MNIANTCNQDLEGGKMDQLRHQKVEHASSSFLDANTGTMIKEGETFL